MNKPNFLINIKFHIPDRVHLLGAIMAFLLLFLAKSIISKIWKRVSPNKIKLKKMKKYWIHIENNCFQKSYQATILILKYLCYLHTSFRKTKNKAVMMEYMDFKDQWQELKLIKKMISQILMTSPWRTMISSL